VVCSLSGKRILKDEAEISAISGNLVARIHMQTSAISGKRAEPAYFGQCEFTGAAAFKTELATSEISGKRYRSDEEVRSAVSGKRGHKQEFVVCHETRQCIALTEAEQCEVTGEFVRPGILEPCAITQKRVLPSELLQCAVTGKRVLKRLLVTSSLSGAHLLQGVAVRSAAGAFCLPSEAKPCIWSGKSFHPDDLRVCGLTGLDIHIEFATTGSSPRLKPLVDLLDGTLRTGDDPSLWDALKTRAEIALESGWCKVAAAVSSPDKRHLAVCVEVRTLLGLRVRHAGLLYEIEGNSVVGRVVRGRRTAEGWTISKG